MSTVGDAADSFELNGRTVTREKGRLTLDDGTLAGSDLDMANAVRFGIEQLELPLEEALRMASLYPAKLLGRDKAFGRIAPGSVADFVHLGDENQVRATWKGGVEISASAIDQ
jgi:N-acetylglucosamine-6-phosphate deacetylase